MLRALGSSAGAAIALHWPDVVRAAHDAHQAAREVAGGGSATLTTLSAADAADIDALTAQIIPTDDTPGAREAGVVWFIDRALGTFLAHWRDTFMRGLRGFQSAVRAAHADGTAFSALDANTQIAFLHTVERTAFFDQARVLTLCGMFSLPKYGGNRGGVGWQLLGFEDRHTFEPPFGHYDSPAGRT